MAPVPPGTKLDAAVTNAVVAFEVDGFDPGDQQGWSVLVQGIAQEVIDRDEIGRLDQLTAASWTDADGRFVRIGTRTLSGRRLMANRAPAWPAEPKPTQAGSPGRK